MKKLSLLFLFGILFCQANAQTPQEKAQLKTIILTGYESVSLSSRQWLVDAAEKHPAGEFDTSYAKRKLNEKLSPAETTIMADIWICMMAYMKMVNKEAREDRKIASHTKRLMLASKTEKLKINNEKIDAGMQEAREKANQAMEAATTNLVAAIVSGLVQIGAASASSTGQEEPKKDSVKSKNRIIPVKTRLSLAQYIKKLEGQLKLINGK